MVSIQRPWSWVVGAALLALQACGSCGGGTGAGDCGEGCPTGQSCVDGACVPAGTGSSSSGGFGTYCDSDAECTMDEFCRVEVHLCVSKHACNTDMDCRLEGQVCRDFTDDGYRECGFEGCNSDAECATEVTCDPATQRARCELRACVCKDTCGGDCGMGRQCCGVAASCPGGGDACCIADPGPCGAQTCNPGFESNPAAGGTWAINSCTYQGVGNCDCIEKAPLPEGIIGAPHTLMVDLGGNLHAAAYAYGPIESDVPATPPYGDLVLGTYNKSGSSWSWRWLDGVPAGGMVTAGPSGPRGGISEAGADTGSSLHAAMAADGTVHVAYRDSSRGALRYMRVPATGDPVAFDLDAVGDAGHHPQVALTSAGNPVITWLNRRDESSGAPVGALKMAVASVAAPDSEAQFTRHVVAQQNLRDIACEGGCPSGTACQDVEAPAIPACIPVATGCAACGMGQFCASTGCVDKVPGSDVYQRAVGPGIMGSLDITGDGTAVLAVFDSVNNRLSIHRSVGALDGASVTFAATHVSAAGQVTGVWPSLAVSGAGQVVVAFANETMRSLQLVELDGAYAVTATRTVDDGMRSDGLALEQHRLAEPRAAFLPDGSMGIAYQDGTTGELLYASGSGTTWTRSTLAGGTAMFSGWFGFSTNIIPRTAGAPIISTFRRNPDPTPQADGIQLFNVE